MKKIALSWVILFLTGITIIKAQTGNVGIGTNSPQSKLHINGEVRIDSLKTTSDADQVVVLDTVTHNLALRPYPVINQSTETLVRIFATTNGNSIPNALVTDITYNSTSINTVPSSWNQATGTFTAPRNGIYNVSANSLYTSNNASTAEFNILIRKNGVPIATAANFDYMTGGNSYKSTGHVEATVSVLENDIITISTYQNSGATQTLHSSTWNYVNINELPSTATTATSTVTHYITEGAATVGDIKQGFQATDHTGWIKLDGRLLSSLSSTQQTAASSLGFSGNLPDATNAYLSQNGATLGNLSGNNTKTIAQSNLPNVTLSGNTSTTGNHSHAIGRRANEDNGAYDPGDGHKFENSAITSDRGYLGSFNSSTEGNHSHTITTSSINGGVTQQSLDITPKTLSVNTFIYLGN